jgi:hypothetical protein
MRVRCAGGGGVDLALSQRRRILCDPFTPDHA